MPTRGERFFFKEEYQEAMEAFLKEEARDKQDSSRHGATLNIAQVLICTGRFKEAEDRLKADRERAIWTMACHPIHLGISCWYRARYQDAVSHFRSALKSQYQSDDGFGTHFVLYFAAIRRPSVIDINEVTQLVTTTLNRWPPPVPSASLYTAQFIAGLIDEAEYLSHAGVQVGRYAKYWERYYRVKAAFYIALSRSRKGDVQMYEEQMQGVSTAVLEQIFTEQVIARMEVRQIQSKAAAEP